MLVKTSLNDSQVMYWEPAKYVAKLRTLKKTRSSPAENQHGRGHGGASGRYDYLREIALRLRLHPDATQNPPLSHNERNLLTFVIPTEASRRFFVRVRF